MSRSSSARPGARATDTGLGSSATIRRISVGRAVPPVGLNASLSIPRRIAGQGGAGAWISNLAPTSSPETRPRTLSRSSSLPATEIHAERRVPFRRRAPGENMDKTERRERVSVREDSIELALEFPRARPISAKQRKAIEDQLWNAWSDN